MSNARIRRMLFNELVTKLTDPVTEELKWSVMQNGVILTDEFGNEIENPEDLNATSIWVDLIPAAAESETLQGDHIRYTGIFQMTIRVYLRSGEIDANIILEEIEDELQKSFKINQRLVDANDTSADPFAVQVISPIKVTEATRKKGGNHWVAVSYFNYRSDTNI